VFWGWRSRPGFTAPKTPQIHFFFRKAGLGGRKARKTWDFKQIPKNCRKDQQNWRAIAPPVFVLYQNRRTSIHRAICFQD
jgi:hypothetical protein